MRMTTPTDQSSEQLRIAVFDVCHTLVAENTTAGFVAHYCDANGLRVRALLVSLIVKRWSPIRVLLAALHRVAGIDLPRRVLIGMLTGQARVDLVRAAGDYVDRLLEKSRVEAIWPLFEVEASRSRIVLASASLCVVVDELARRFSADAIASRLEYSQGRCTGRLISDATGKKEDLLQALLPDEIVPIWLFVCTDNRSDAPLLRAADEGVAVLYPGRRGLQGTGLPVTVRRILVDGSKSVERPGSGGESE